MRFDSCTGSARWARSRIIRPSEEALPEEEIVIEAAPKKRKRKPDDEYKCGGAVARKRLDKGHSSIKPWFKGGDWAP